MRPSYQTAEGQLSILFPNISNEEQICFRKTKSMCSNDTWRCRLFASLGFVCSCIASFLDRISTHGSQVATSSSKPVLPHSRGRKQAPSPLLLQKPREDCDWCGFKSYDPPQKKKSYDLPWATYYAQRCEIIWWARPGSCSYCWNREEDLAPPVLEKLGNGRDFVKEGMLREEHVSFTTYIAYFPSLTMQYV